MISVETYRDILARQGFTFLSADEDPLMRNAYIDHPSSPKVRLNAMLTSASISGDTSRLAIFSTFGSSPMEDANDGLTIAVTLDRLGDERIAEGVVEAIATQFVNTHIHIG